MKIGKPFNPYQVFVGAFIPNCIMATSILTPIEKLLWARLSQYSGTQGRCFPKQSSLAKELSISEVWVQKNLKSLEEKQFIKRIQPTNIEKIKHKNNTYVFLWHSIFEQNLHGENADLDVCEDDVSHPYDSIGGHTNDHMGSHTNDHMGLNYKEDHCLKHTLSKEKNLTFSRTKQPKKDLLVDKNQKYIPLAEQLAQIIKKKKHIHIPNSQIDKWSDEIRRLCKTSKINPLRIKRALDWYAEHIGEEFVPEIFAGSSLRKKFTNLESAMERSKNPYQQKDNRPSQSRHEVVTDEDRQRYRDLTTTVKV